MTERKTSAPEETRDDRNDDAPAAAGDRDVELAAGLIAVGAEQHPWLQRMGLDASQLATAGAVTVVAGTPREMADALLRAVTASV